MHVISQPDQRNPDMNATKHHSSPITGTGKVSVMAGATFPCLSSARNGRAVASSFRRRCWPGCASGISAFRPKRVAFADSQDQARRRVSQLSASRMSATDPAMWAYSSR